MINNIINNKPLPVYGEGENIRDWLFVEDHALAIDAIFHKGKSGEVYNIGGNNEWKNIDLVNFLCYTMDQKLGREEGTSAKLITYVRDRPGHDLRYAIDASKLISETGWRPQVTFEVGLEQTVDWYLANQEWLKHVTSGEYLRYYTKMYKVRGNLRSSKIYLSTLYKPSGYFECLAFPSKHIALGIKVIFVVRPPEYPVISLDVAIFS